MVKLTQKIPNVFFNEMEKYKSPLAGFFVFCFFFSLSEAFRRCGSQLSFHRHQPSECLQDLWQVLLPVASLKDVGSTPSLRLTADAMKSDSLPLIVSIKCLLQIISRLKEVKAFGPSLQLDRGQHNSLIFIEPLFCARRCDRPFYMVCHLYYK